MVNTLSKGEQARTEILDAALGLFLSKGYGASSMRDIAQASGGRAVAGMYNHFPNKQAIFQALLEARNPFDDLFAILETMQGETGPDFIANLLRRAMPMMIQHLDFLELLHIDLREFQGAYFTQLVQNSVLPRAARIVQRLATLPGLKPLSPMVLVRIMASLVIGYILTEQFMPDVIRDELSHEAWITTYIDSLLYGVAAPGEAHSLPEK